MPGMPDFRALPFSRSRVDNCGRYLGHHTYWKLYSIENYIRVMLHSALSVQIAPNWWDTAVDPPTKRNVEKLKQDYLARPVHALPGRHEIYYLYLSDLTRIMVGTRHLLMPLIPDIDSWIAKVEGIRIPRNLIGHMNFPSATDRNRIDLLHRELGDLMRKLEQNRTLEIAIP
jgi:hypothetical protein